MWQFLSICGLFFSPHSGWFAALSVVYLTSLSLFCLYFYLFCISSWFYWVTFTFPGLSFEQKPNKNIKCETKAGLMFCFRCQWTKNQTSQRTANRHTSFRYSRVLEWVGELRNGLCVFVCVYTSQVFYLDRKCYAKRIIEALCTCLLRSAGSVDSDTDKVWQLGDDEQHSDAFQTLYNPNPPPTPPLRPNGVIPTVDLLL